MRTDMQHQHVQMQTSLQDGLRTIRKDIVRLQ